jgi:hypothetical protein
VTAGIHSAGGSPAAGLEMQSHPSPMAQPEHSAQQPALTVVIPSGNPLPGVLHILAAVCKVSSRVSVF